jgi:hypothetical protein
VDIVFTFILSFFIDIRKLTCLSLLTLFGLFFALISTIVASFLFTALPYGWPKKSFVLFVPARLQTLMFAIVGKFRLS